MKHFILMCRFTMCECIRGRGEGVQRKRERERGGGGKSELCLPILICVRVCSSLIESLFAARHVLVIKHYLGAQNHSCVFQF